MSCLDRAQALLAVPHRMGFLGVPHTNGSSATLPPPEFVLLSSRNIQFGKMKKGETFSSGWDIRYQCPKENSTFSGMPMPKMPSCSFFAGRKGHLHFEEGENALCSLGMFNVPKCLRCGCERMSSTTFSTFTTSLEETSRSSFSCRALKKEKMDFKSHRKYILHGFRFPGISSNPWQCKMSSMVQSS